MRTKLFIILTVFTFLLLAAGTASACLCAYPGTVDREFGRRAVVGVFKLQTIFERQERTDKPETPDNTTEEGLFATVRHVKFSVEKVFKGSLKPGQEVNLLQISPTNCDRSFGEDDQGTEYLLYLNSDPSKDKDWKISYCSRSDDIKSAAADLLYLENMANVSGKTRLSGSVRQRFGVGAQGEQLRTVWLAGSPVVITGNGKTFRRLKTDKNGAYEIYDLAPGRYQVTPVKIKGFDFAGSHSLPYAEVEIKAGAQAEQNFTFVIDNAIGGRVLDSKGRGVDNVHVKLVPARGRRPEDFLEDTITANGGYFEFKSVRVEAAGDKAGIELRFPFTACGGQLNH
jgi:hypothetical protein